MAEKIEAWTDGAGTIHRSEAAANVSDATRAVRDVVSKIWERDEKKCRDRADGPLLLDEDDLGEWLLNNTDVIVPLLQVLQVVRRGAR